jgi:hypothetical protein
VPGKTKKVNWPFVDPANATMSRDEQLQLFRTIRDQIRTKLG